MKQPFTFMILGLMLLPIATQADLVSKLQANYTKQSSLPFTASQGAALWQRQFTDLKSGQLRSCTSCHTNNLQASGKHARTGKSIEPMAPSTNPARLTDATKVEKWFKRNCKWTLGRECTPQEKGDLLAFISSR